MTRVIGLDLSLTATGVASEHGLHTIRSKALGDGLPERAARVEGIVSGVRHAVTGVSPWLFTDPPELVVIEAPAFSRTTGHHHDRSGLWWLVIDRLRSLDIPVVEVPPTSLKKFATGRGNADKGDVRLACYKHAGLEVRDDNQADAYWLRQIGLHLLDDPDRTKLPATHLAALAKIHHLPADTPAPF